MVQVPWGKSHPTFFFYNMEWRKLVQGGNYNQQVPNPSTYTGNFGATAINVPDVAHVTPSVLFAGCGGVAPPGIVQGSPFPNNTIPSCMLNANAQALLGAGIFPSANQWQSVPGNSQHADRRSGRDRAYRPPIQQQEHDLRALCRGTDRAGIRHHDVER